MKILLRVFLVSCLLVLQFLDLEAQNPCSFTLEQGPVVYEDCLEIMNASVIVTGGSGNFQYLWSDNTTVDSILTVTDPVDTVYSCAVFDLDEQCVDVIVITINVPTNIGGDVTIIGDTLDCENKNRELYALIIGGSNDFTYTWSNGDSTQRAFLTPPFPDFVRVDITDNITGCDTFLIQNITSIPAPVALFDTQDTLCPLEPIFIVNQSEFPDGVSFIAYRWFLNGYEKSNDVVPEFLANDTGFTHLKLLIVDAFCSDSISKSVPVYPYNAINSEIIVQEDRFTEIRLQFPDDAQLDSCIVYWGDGDSTLAACNFPDARHYYEDYGSYEIILSYVNRIGCKIERVLDIDVIPELKIYFPKALSPDGDGLNETFGPMSDELDKVDGTFNVYNRRGQVIFSTTEPGKVWDGKVNGNIAPEGFYHYSYEFKPLNGSEKNLGTSKGYFMLIK